MKTIIISALLFSFSSYAGYGKAELLARYSGMDSYNAPMGMSCFTSEPQPTESGVYLGCRDSNSFAMVRWTPKFEVITHTLENIFSHPQNVERRVTWYGFNESGIQNFYEVKNQSLKKTPLNNLGSIGTLIDSFIPIKHGLYIYRSQQGSNKTLNLWSNQNTSIINLGALAYLFPPVSSHDGVAIIKVRRGSIEESSPDDLILLDDQTKIILQDRDANPASPVKSFRHQYAYDQGAIALVITDDKGEALVLIKAGRMHEIARVGKDLASIDFFSPKLRNGVLIFRGVDFQNRKALYIYEKSQLKVLLKQGDIVMTDKGSAQINYKNQDAIFFGAPGIGPNGDIYQQATLTSPDSTMTFLGIGLMKLRRE